jgi:tetratricopeptide (TPR) repeat protein
MIRTADLHENGEVQQSEAIKEFRLGLVQLQRGLPGDALEYLRHSVALEPRNAYFLSYYGLALGLARRKWDEAESLCMDALRIKRTIPQLYLNLADVYRRSGRVADAVETLTEGLHYTGRDFRLADALQRFGIRHRPVVSFLPRSNALNRCLGRLRQAARGVFRRRD